MNIIYEEFVNFPQKLSYNAKEKGLLQRNIGFQYKINIGTMLLFQVTSHLHNQ